MNKDNLEGLTPEQRRYLEIIEEERRRNGGRRPEGGGRKPQKRRSRNLGYAAGEEKKGKTHRGKVSVAIICLLIIAICFGLLAWLYFSNIVSNFDTVKTAAEEFDIDEAVAEDLKNYRNVAVLGSDGRKGEGFDGTRTDAVIVASVHKQTGKIKLISIMRDSYLEIKDAKGEQKLDKITHAHAYGGGVDTCASLNRNLDLNISEFVIFSWQAVADLVDAMGGIEVDVEYEELYDLNRYGEETARNVGKTFTPVYDTGNIKLDGVQAATYCRIRKTSGGDTGRGKRMKAVMAALIKKAKTKDLAELNDIAVMTFPKIRTNITQRGMLKTVAGIGDYDITSNMSWPENYYGGTLNGAWYTVPRTLESQVKRLHNKAFGQKEYTPTERCRSISNQIVEHTGVQ